MSVCHTFKSPFSSNTTQHIIDSHDGQITLMTRVDREVMDVKTGDGAVLECSECGCKCCWIADVKDAEWFNHNRTVVVTLDIR